MCEKENQWGFLWVEEVSTFKKKDEINYCPRGDPILLSKHKSVPGVYSLFLEYVLFIFYYLKHVDTLYFDHI